VVLTVMTISALLSNLLIEIQVAIGSADRFCSGVLLASW
jgi:hypothetical protein